MSLPETMLAGKFANEEQNDKLARTLVSGNLGNSKIKCYHLYGGDNELPVPYVTNWDNLSPYSYHPSGIPYYDINGSIYMLN